MHGDGVDGVLGRLWKTGWWNYIRHLVRRHQRATSRSLRGEENFGAFAGYSLLSGFTRLTYLFLRVY